MTVKQKSARHFLNVSLNVWRAWAATLAPLIRNKSFVLLLVVLGGAPYVGAQSLVVTCGGQTQSQGVTLSINTIPNMPNLVLSVNGGTSCDAYSYQISITYSDQAGAATGTNITFNAQDVPGDQSSTVDWFSNFEGGNATITWAFDGVQQSTFGFFINGSNAGPSAVDAYASSGPWFIRNLITQESSYREYDTFGYPLWNTPDGIGLMQLEPPARASGDNDYWSWSANVADGLSWLYNEKQGPAYNSWTNELQQMQSDMAPGQKYPPDTEFDPYCYFSYPQNGNDSYADGDWIHYYNGNYFIFWNHSTLSWDIDLDPCSSTTGYVRCVCKAPPQ